MDPNMQEVVHESRCSACCSRITARFVASARCAESSTRQCPPGSPAEIYAWRRNPSKPAPRDVHFRPISGTYNAYLIIRPFLDLLELYVRPILGLSIPGIFQEVERTLFQIDLKPSLEANCRPIFQAVWFSISGPLQAYFQGYFRPMLGRFILGQTFKRLKGLSFQF